MEFSPDDLVRDNIKKMTAYSSARHEFSGHASVFLDANENAMGSPLVVSPGSLTGQYNRYPDPMQLAIKKKLSTIKGVPPQNIFLGNGSDEAIDLLFRIFTEPGKDNVLILPPTYGMYEVCAELNNVTVKKIPLTADYQPDLDRIADAIDPFTKIIFLCSPNNPTGNSMRRPDIEIMLNNFDGLVVIDEAYINYAKQKTFIQELTEYPNLVILQTLSKAWGLAGLRLGMGFASERIIYYMNKVKYPYNINAATQELVLEALDNTDMVNEWIRQTIQQRDWLTHELAALPLTIHVFDSDANFLLVKLKDAHAVYEYLAGKGIVVRDRSGVQLCESSLRITIGTEEENKLLIEALKNYPS